MPNQSGEVKGWGPEGLVSVRRHQELPPCWTGPVSDTRAKIPMKPMMKTTVTQIVSLQPVEDRGRTDIHTGDHGGPHTGASVSTLRKGVACGEPTMEQASGRSRAHEGDPMQEQVFWKDLGLWGGPVCS